MNLSWVFIKALFRLGRDEAGLQSHRLRSTLSRRLFRLNTNCLGMVGKVSDRSFIYWIFGQSCGLAVIFQEFCCTDSFPPWRNVHFALQCSLIRLFSYISSDEYSWYPICSPPLSPYCETVIILLLSFNLHFFFFLAKRKTRQGRTFVWGEKKSFTIFSFFLRFFSLFHFSGRPSSSPFRLLSPI